MMVPCQKDEQDMTDHSDHFKILPLPLQRLVGLEHTETITVPVDQVFVDSARRRLVEARVLELMESIICVGLLNPINVVVRKSEDEGEKVVLVAGGHRLEAVKQLGQETIQCTVLEYDDAGVLERSVIEENTARHDLSPARHALLTHRRGEMIDQSLGDDERLSQIATASKQARQRGSVRDQASKSGETKDRIQRSRKWFRDLGEDLLCKIADTSLDSGVELNALAKLPEEVRETLANRAAAGETVSARKEKAKLDGKSAQTQDEKALVEFSAWKAKYSNSKKLAGLARQISEIQLALSASSQ
jgi:ParB/RepB/Spo0J family partition protein